MPVSKDALLEAAWAGLVVDESNLPVQIAAARKVLGQEPGGERWIETLPRRGYRFVGPVGRADCESTPTTSSKAAGASPSEGGLAHLPLTPRMEPERRQLTIAFCELICPSASAFDIEDLADVIRAYRRSVADTARRCNGSIGKHIGNVVVVHFGHPEAHEDDAEQAVQAGLRLCTVVKELAAEVGRALSLRVGIATGLVIVNDAANVGEPQEGGIVGEAPTLAGRLLGLAKPDTVVIDAVTRRLIGNLFSYRDLGPVEPVGMAASAQAWQVLGPSAINNRFEALRGANPAPLVGRDEELEVLRRRWAQARSGEGRVVLVAGEPGIGKSRLTRALLELLQSEPHTRLQYDCSPYHQDSALHPIIRQLLRVAGMEHEDAPDQKLSKLKAVLAPATKDHNETVALLAPLLSIPLGPEYVQLDLNPQRRRELTIRALLSQLKALADSQPVLMIVEDAHWMDPTSLEFLSHAIERIGNLSVLLVITARPGFASPWPSYTYVSTLRLNRLGRHQGEALIQRITRGKALPAEVLDQIIAQTDGVPLFVEELTKTVLESGLLEHAGDRYVLRSPLPPLAIPSTLHASLLARLDRLAGVKDVAQTAAVIGREFPYALISAVAGLPQGDLQAALAQLVAAELVFQRGVPPDAKYVFKHALVQEAAYASLVRRRRQQLHAEIARALEAQFPDVVTSEPEVLAHHFTEAGRADCALPWWRRAGERARERSANLEAVRHIGKALDLISSLPETPARLEEELALRMAIAAPLIATKGYAALEVEGAYRAARDLCHRLDRPADLFPALRGLWNCYSVRGALQPAYDLAEQLVGLADAEEERPLWRALSRRAIGTSLISRGDFITALRHLEEGIGFSDAVEDVGTGASGLALYGEHPGIVCRLYLGWVLWFLGFSDQGLAQADKGLAMARLQAHAHMLAFALDRRAVVHLFRREHCAALRHAEETIAVATEQGLPQWRAAGLMCRGFARAGLGQAAEGIADLRTGLAAYHATGGQLGNSWWLGFLAAAHAGAGQIEEALVALDAAMEWVTSAGEQIYEAELYRLRGEVLLAQSDNAASATNGEPWLRKALACAGKQSARSLQIRAATSLARLWREQGKHVEARNLLVPIYGWFTEGFDTIDLKEARSLLDELTCSAPQQH